MSSSASPGGEMATRSSDRPMRERIVAAAIQVIRERGVTRATTKEIARAAKVSEGSIYNHFENKTALFGAAFGAVTSGIPAADPAFIAATLLGACLQHAFLSLLADPAALAAVGLPPDASEYARGVVRTVLAGNLPNANRP